MAPVEDGREEDELVEIQEEEAEQDAEPLRVAKDPKLPSQEDVESHRCSHIPFREWCRHCVLGRGRGDPHLRTAGSSIPVVGLDYFFIDGDKVKARKELDYPDDPAGEANLEAARAAGTLIKCLVVRCAATKNVFGHVIPRKGADEEDFAANRVVKIVEWLGHTELILKGDNEPALQALTARALELIRVRVTKVAKIGSETPPAYDSQSNGAVEVGVMLIRGMFRTIRLCLEARLDRKIPVDHALVPWLLEHACLLINVKSRGADGLTGWARARGRNFAQKLVGFGEKVLYKLPMKGPHAAANMDAKWADGACLGYSWTSNTYVIETREGGITTARSLRRVPMPNRWCPETLSKISATPWARRERATEVRFTDPAPVPDEPVAVAPPVLRDASVSLTRTYAATASLTAASNVATFNATDAPRPGSNTMKCAEHASSTRSVRQMKARHDWLPTKRALTATWPSTSNTKIGNEILQSQEELTTFTYDHPRHRHGCCNPTNRLKENLIPRILDLPTQASTHGCCNLTTQYTSTSTRAERMRRTQARLYRTWTPRAWTSTATRPWASSAASSRRPRITSASCYCSSWAAKAAASNAKHVLHAHESYPKCIRHRA